MRNLSSRLGISMVIFLFSVAGAWAVSYPTTTPSGEQAGGWFQTYFDNMFTSEALCYDLGKVVGGLTGSGVPICVTPVASGLFVLGQTAGDTLRFDGTDWARSDIIYNDGSNVGIGTQTPGAKLDVSGTVKISGGTPGLGKVLTSDASGLATWETPTSSTSWELLGNSGTVAGTNFLGTADNVSLIFKVNNTLAGNLGNTADSNTYLGLSAGSSSNVNLSNVGIGKNSLFASITGPYNTAIGLGSLYTNVIGSSNTANGYNALFLSTGNSNTALGQNAGSTLTSGDNNIFVGAGTTPNIATTASNQLNIGNWIYGNSGSIGIGVLNPGAKLDIAGTIKITDGTQGSGKVLISDNNGLAYWGSATASSVTASGITGGTEFYVTKFGLSGNGLLASQIYDDSANVGIGTAVPGAKLDIAGTIKIQGGSPGIGKVLVSDASGLASWGNPAVATNVYATGVLAMSSSGGYVTKFMANGSGITSSVMFESGSFLGINTTSPTAGLDINGQIRLRTGAANGYMLISDTNGLATWTGQVVATSLNITGAILGNTLYYNGTNWIPSNNIYNSGSNIGIGTATPGAKLEVNGQVKITGGSPGVGKTLVSDATGLASWGTPSVASTVYATGVLAMSSSGGYVTKFMANGSGITSSVMFENNGKIGINTINPTYMLDVQGSGSIIRAGSGFCLGMTASGCVDDWTDLNNVVKSMGTPDYIAKFNSGGLIDNSQLYETGGKLYIGDIPEIISGGATIGYVTIEANGSTNSSNPFLTLSENGGQECRMWINGANKLGSNCAWTAGLGGSYEPNQIIKANSAGIDLTGSIIYENGGNVGIGINNPSYKFHVGGSAFFTGNVTVQGNLIVDKIVNRSVNNVSISGSLLPDTSAPLTYRDIGSSTQRWNNLYLSGQIAIGGGSPGLGKYLVSDATGLASWTGLVTATSLNLAGAVLGNTLYYNGTNWVVSNNIYNTGGNVGIGITGTAPIPTSKFEVWSGGTTQSLLHFRGSNNVGLGLNTVRYQTTGSANVGFGNNVLRTLSTGYSNSAFGDSAMYNNMQGYFNTAGGTQALYTNSNGNWNIALGSQALYTNNGGSNNVGIGGQALYLNSAGDNNTAVGDNALRATTGDNNTALGFGAGSGITTGSNNIAIGAAAQVYSNTASNQLNIGNWIYGSGGNIGIGTGGTAITAKFTIDSGVSNTSGLRLSRVSATTPIFGGVAAPLGVDTSGNVVIAQQGAIPVYTALGATPGAAINTTTNPPTIGADYDKYFTINARQSFTVTDVGGNPHNCPEFTIGTSNKGVTGCTQTPWATYVMTAQNATSGDRYAYQILISDRVDAPFVVRGGMYDESDGDLENTAMTVPALWFKAITVPTNRSNWFYINPGVDQNNNPITGGGNIGIGTTTPGYNLDIRGEVAMMNRVYLTGTVATAASPTLSFAGDTNMGLFRPAADTLSFATNGSERMRIFSNGNVTIGGTTNSAKLRVDGQVMITGGIPGAGKVLTSDASGLATWQTPSGGGGGSTILQATVNRNLPSIGNNACSLQTFNVPGAVTGKTAWISPELDLGSSTNTTLFIASVRVSAADTVEVKFCNESGSSVDRPAMDFYVSVIQ